MNQQLQFLIWNWGTEPWWGFRIGCVRQRTPKLFIEAHLSLSSTVTPNSKLLWSCGSVLCLAAFATGAWMHEWVGDCEALFCEGLWVLWGVEKRYLNTIHLPCNPFNKSGIYLSELKKNIFQISTKSGKCFPTALTTDLASLFKQETLTMQWLTG